MPISAWRSGTPAGPHSTGTRWAKAPVTKWGWPVAANPVGIELPAVKQGSPTRPLPGWDVRILSESGAPGRGRSERGTIVMKLTTPPGALLELWNDDAFVRSYSGTISPRAQANSIDPGANTNLPR